MGREGPPGQLYLPPGFRFYPTDEELVVQYLCKKTASQLFPVPIIADVDLYRFDPWDLPEKALFGEKEWYFFSPRDRKYPNGSRPNRAAGSGYWKATGTDKPIYSTTNGHKQLVGVKKALVFYIGKAPKGNKTNWIMHEYRLADASARAAKRKGSLRLDDWVLCRIYKKSMGVQKAAAAAAAAAAKECNESSSCLDEVLASLSDIDDTKLMNLPRLNSMRFLMEDQKADMEVKDSGDNRSRSPTAQHDCSWLNSINPNINNNNSVPAMMDLGHKDQQYSNITEVDYNNNNNQQKNGGGTCFDLAAALSRRPPRPPLMHDSPDEEVQSSFRLHHNENLVQSSAQPLGFGLDTQVAPSFTPPPPPQDPQLYPLNLVFDNQFLASLGPNYIQRPQ